MHPSAQSQFSADDLNRAVTIFDASATPTWQLIEETRRLRSHAYGNRVHLCMILNARSGACSEDCAFCSQSRHHQCEVPIYPLVSSDYALENARKAEAAGARCFSLVTSGRSLTSQKERHLILEMVALLRENTGLEIALSPGLAEPSFLRDLQRAGLSTFHHNLETAPDFYGCICTTHPFEERMQTVLLARDAGLTVCSGGIFGLGESLRQRAELALIWKQLPIDRIPVNFLNPIPGTALQDRKRLRPLEALHIIAALRRLIPDKEILLCGGRNAVLRSLQPFLFAAGASGMMTGDYLTTSGTGIADDRAMLDDLEMQVEKQT